MHYRHLIFLIIPAVLILGGCEIRSKTDIYVADLYENADLSTPATMSVEIPSCSGDNRAEAESNILSIFSDSSDASIVDCRNEGMTSLLQIDLSAMISNARSQHDVTFVRNREGSTTELAVHIHPRFFERAQNMASKQYTSIDPDDLSISIRLHNDTRGSVHYTINEGWVGRDPVMNYTETLERRDRARIRFTDVVSEWVFTNRGPMILRVVNERADVRETAAPRTPDDSDASGEEPDLTTGAAAASDEGTGPAAAIALDAGEARRGQEHYRACVGCHGPRGQGTPVFPALADKSAEYIAEMLVRYRAGERVGDQTVLMAPNAERLSDREIADLAVYVATFEE